MHADSLPYDVVTLGETMIRWTPSHCQRIEQVHSMELHVGGAESNTAVGLARLGNRTAWISRLTSNPLGRVIEGTLCRYGVDTHHVVWTNEDRVGLYFLEEGKEPRGSQVFYDRKGSAISKMQPSELPASLFQPGRSKCFHTTGITAAIGSAACATAREAFRLARQAGWKLSFDTNYRAKLWSPNEASMGCVPFMEQTDVLFIPERDARTLFPEVASLERSALVLWLSKRFPNAIIAFTAGKEGSWGAKGDQMVNHGIFPADTIGRLGGGDAFAAGFLHAYLQDLSLNDCLRWGSATASMKYSIPGDLPLVDRSAVEALVLSHGSNSIVR